MGTLHRARASSDRVGLEQRKVNLRRTTRADVREDRTDEPSGTGYSSSMQAGKVYFSFFINCKISLIAVSPWPHGIFGPCFIFRFLKCSLVRRSCYCLMKAAGETLLPAVKWPMSMFAPFHLE